MEELNETKTKIMATIGPSSESEEMIQRLIKSGVDIFRVNLSHGNHEWHETVFHRIRKLASHIPILFDISGPKIRLGELKQPFLLHKGAEFSLTSKKIIGDDTIASVDYPWLPREVKLGDKIFINDGLVALEVLESDDITVRCKILAGGPISSRKGINLPSSSLTLRVPTKKDTRDIILAARLGIDFLAVSFVNHERDLDTVKYIIHDNNPDIEIPLIAKIERPDAVSRFKQILKNSYGIMLARGDLGVELPTELVPAIQKEFILSCNRVGKPVIVATQMLESMRTSPIPTRAETNDVFNAVFDGTDCVMLSAETASGKFPLETVLTMDKICRSAERIMPKRDPDLFDSEEKVDEEILGHAVHHIIKKLQERGTNLKAIIVSTRSGYSALMVAKYRPPVPIIAVTFDERTFRKLNFVWGVQPLFLDVPVDMDQFSKNYKTIKLAQSRKWIDSNDTILMVSGSFLAPDAKTSTISLYKVGEIMDLP